MARGRFQVHGEPLKAPGRSGSAATQTRVCLNFDHCVRGAGGATDTEPFSRGPADPLFTSACSEPRRPGSTFVTEPGAFGSCHRCRGGTGGLNPVAPLAVDGERRRPVGLDRLWLFSSFKTREIHLSPLQQLKNNCTE